ncbi:tetratricopeptide repeat protein [Clostridium thailandense]|uniref:tetratricopeptide repeat protein n=1 Tax=Clostridium thailandense TaxID=2794346 RepID=UPI003989ED49
MRTRLIIFGILSLIVAGLAYKTYLDNRNYAKSIVEKQNASNTNNQTTVITKKEDKQDVDTEAKKIQEEKNKRLEEKYEQSSKLFSDKKYKDTINIANDIIKEDENFYKAYNIKGIALCYSGNYEEGMKNIDKSLQLKPDFGYGRFNKALAYELNGNYDDALNWYDKDLEVENYVWSYYGKASIYGRRGDVANTTKYLKIAIDMAPEIKKNASEEADFNPVKESKEFQDLIK